MHAGTPRDSSGSLIIIKIAILCVKQEFLSIEKFSVLLCILQAQKPGSNEPNCRS